MFELVHTSAARGLLPGTSGFTTVAMTAGMPLNLLMPLENLSGYNFTFSGNTLLPELNPPCCQYIKQRFGNQLLHIASRIAPCGLDYSRRNNKIAHHWLFESREEIMQTRTGPAGLLMFEKYFYRFFDQDPQELPFQAVPSMQPSVLPAETFRKLSGDSGFAGVIAERFRQPNRQALYLQYDRRTPTEELLQLVCEICALLNEDELADFTFSTYFNSLGNSSDCFLRMVPDFSPLLNNLNLFHKNDLFILDPAGTLPEEYINSPLCMAARGVCTVPENDCCDCVEDDEPQIKRPLPPLRLKTIEQPPRSQSCRAPQPTAVRQQDNRSQSEPQTFNKRKLIFILICIMFLLFIGLPVLLLNSNFAKKTDDKPSPAVQQPIKVQPHKHIQPEPPKSQQTSLHKHSRPHPSQPPKQTSTVPAGKPVVPRPVRRLHLDSMRKNVLQADIKNSLQFFIQLQKVPASLYQQYTLHLPSQLWQTEEVYVELNHPGKDQPLVGSSSFIQAADAGGIIIIDTIPGSVPPKALTDHSRGASLTIIPGPDGRTLKITAQKSSQPAIIPELKNIKTFYFRIQDDVFICNTKFDPRYLECIPIGKLTCSLEGYFSYTPSSELEALRAFVEPRIGNTRLNTLCSQYLPIKQWNQAAAEYAELTQKITQTEQKIQKLLHPDVQAMTAAELKQRWKYLETIEDSKNITEQIIQKTKKTLQAFLSRKLTAPQTASIKEIENFAQKAVELIKKHNDDKKSQKLKAQIKSLEMIVSDIRKLHQLLSDKTEAMNKLGKLRTKCNELHQKITNIITPIGSGPMRYLKSKLIDPTDNHPKQLGNAELKQLSALMQNQIKIYQTQDKQ